MSSPAPLSAGGENSRPRLGRLGPARRVCASGGKADEPSRPVPDLSINAAAGSAIMAAAADAAAMEARRPATSREVETSGDFKFKRTGKVQGSGGSGGASHRHNPMQRPATARAPPVAKAPPSYLQPTKASATRKEVAPTGSRRAFGATLMGAGDGDTCAFSDFSAAADASVVAPLAVARPSTRMPEPTALPAPATAPPTEAAAPPPPSPMLMMPSPNSYALAPASSAPDRPCEPLVPWASVPPAATSDRAPASATSQQQVQIALARSNSACVSLPPESVVVTPEVLTPTDAGNDDVSQLVGLTAAPPSDALAAAAAAATYSRPASARGNHNEAAIGVGGEVFNYPSAPSPLIRFSNSPRPSATPRVPNAARSPKRSPASRAQSPAASTADSARADGSASKRARRCKSTPGPSPLVPDNGDLRARSSSLNLPSVSGAFADDLLDDAMVTASAAVATEAAATEAATAASSSAAIVAESSIDVSDPIGTPPSSAAEPSASAQLSGGNNGMTPRRASRLSTGTPHAEAIAKAAADGHWASEPKPNNANDELERLEMEALLLARRPKLQRTPPGSPKAGATAAAAATTDAIAVPAMNLGQAAFAPSAHAAAAAPPLASERASARAAAPPQRSARAPKPAGSSAAASPAPSASPRVAAAGAPASARGVGRLSELAVRPATARPAVSSALPSGRVTKDSLLKCLGERLEPLKGVDEDWELRTASLKAIPPLLTQSVDLGALDALLEGLHVPFGTQSADLRSSVVRVACATLSQIAKEHGRAISPLAIGVLPTLLKNYYVSVKAISQTSETTATTLVAEVPTSGALAVLLQFSTDSHHQTRRGAADLMATAIRNGLVLAPAQVSSILAALKKLTGDADSKVREAAGKCFWLVHAQFQAPAESFREKLEPAQQKLLKRTQPK